MIQRASRFVYFIRPEDGSAFVKIGCSVKPEGRLHACRAGSPVPLMMAAQMPGDFSIEWGLHARFQHLHLHHEWFRVDAELECVIEQVRSGMFDAASLPAPQRLAYARGGPARKAA